MSNIMEVLSEKFLRILKTSCKRMLTTTWKSTCRSNSRFLPNGPTGKSSPRRWSAPRRARKLGRGNGPENTKRNARYTLKKFS
jgi:hypothetical protein